MINLTVKKIIKPTPLNPITTRGIVIKARLITAFLDLTCSVSSSCANSVLSPRSVYNFSKTRSRNQPSKLDVISAVICGDILVLISDGRRQISTNDAATFLDLFVDLAITLFQV